jgi:hypothetical protein
MMSESVPRPTYAPRVPVGWIVRLYRSDAMGLHDTELVDNVGWRLHTARNLLEGRPRAVLATLDALAGTGDPAREDVGDASGS